MPDPEKPRTAAFWVDHSAEMAPAATSA